MDREKLIAELVRDECSGQLKLNAYRDSVGLWTIGVGHLLGATQRMTVITGREAMALLDADIDDATKIALSLVPGLECIAASRARALVNMAFNLGPKLSKFKLFLPAVNGARWEEAGVEMLQSKWARQVGARATRLRDMIVTGEDV